MRRIRKLELMQAKEKLRQQKSISDLKHIEEDSKNCEILHNELSKLLKETGADFNQVGVNSFISNRILMHKMMDQKDIVENRIDFLSNEKSELLRLVKQSKIKSDVFNKKKEIERKKYADAKELKALDKLGRVSKQF
jgi:hypothetical protein